MVPLMQPNLNATVAANARAEMARRGEKQADLALAAGWTKATASRRLNGSSDWTATDLDRIAAHFGIAVADRFHEVPEGVAS